MNRKILFCACSLLIPWLLNAQIITQNIRGQITDLESKATLPGVVVLVADDSIQTLAATSDENGNYKITHVPVGRHTIKFKLIGYNVVTLQNINVTSGKEVIVNVTLEQQVTKISEATVSATTKSEVINEMAMVSARSFTPEETQRYAGSREDAARMASNFAGVQGADDSRNDIVIRGNSPAGLLWRVEGVDIANPNHFAVPGTTGSAISLLNSKTFANSDFLTGAMPAEYGNAVAGVFDLRLRNGNNQKPEFTGQFGFLGVEMMAEGPFNKEKGSSYLVAYRYSTLKIFEAMNIKIGTDAVPTYQDLTFKLNFPTKKAGTFSVFSIGGKSDISILVSNQTKPSNELYGQEDRDQYFGSKTAVAGITHSYQWNGNTYSKIVISVQLNNVYAFDSLVYRSPAYVVDSLVNTLNYRFIDKKVSANLFFNTRFNSKNILKAGVIMDELFYDYRDSLLNLNTYKYEVRENYDGHNFMIQPYVEYKHKLNNNLNFTAGAHYLYSTINSHSSAAEVRGAAVYKFKDNQSIAYGFGMHSQLASSYIYFAQQLNHDGKPVQINHNISPTNSIHNVLSYRLTFNSSSHILIETYYQHLYNVPVEWVSSSVSLINHGASYTPYYPDSLHNAGTGNNAGIEFTFEKYFSKSYFLLFTTSLYNSTYKGSDGVKRNTDYNGNFIVNSVGGKEWKMGKKEHSVLLTSAKVAWAGGTRYSPVDTAYSNSAGELVVVDSLRNSKQFKDYFRVDIKLGFRIDAKKTSHEIAVDLVNVFNIKNVLGLTYIPNGNPPLQEEYQLGFLPLFYYKIDF